VKKFALDEYEVHCMRPYKGKKDTFVFPEVADLAVVKLGQIKTMLDKPNIFRGRHVFSVNIV
jgi:hypothetical protein